MGNSGSFILGLPFAVVFVLWIVCGVVAAVVAPWDRRMTFFLITLFFLGPIGIAAAAIAQPRRQLGRVGEPDARTPTPGQLSEAQSGGAQTAAQWPPVVQKVVDSFNENFKGPRP